MRTLAQRLGSVVDHVFGEVQCSVDELAAMGWQRAYESFAQNMFDVLHRRRNVASLLVGQAPTGPNALAQRERLLAVMLDDGFTPMQAARSYAAVARYVLGFATQLSDQELDSARVSRIFHELNPQVFPATRAVADYLSVPLAEEFALGLTLIIDGLARMRHRASRANTRSTTT